MSVSTVGVVAFASPWSWGYYSYYNPYWVAPVGTVTYINYSQPVIVATPAIPVTESNRAIVQADALAKFDVARQLFKSGEYQAAQSEVDRAIALLPNDTVMHEFRALCMFARRDYQPGAAAVHSVLSAGPGWDWATVSELYPSIEVYNGQLRALEGYCQQRPQAADARFLLAYHYLLAGKNDQAASTLDRVVQLQPKDQLAAQLLKGLRTPEQDQPQQPTLARADTGPVEPEIIVGNWKASRPDGSQFELTLGDDDTFSWKCTQQDKQQQFSGKYTLANNFLILSANEQNTLVGKVSVESDEKFSFRLAGANPAEPALTFTR